jgi:hypothetical protein
MRIPNFTLPLALCMSLFVPAAMAENLSIPDKEHRQGMSYEEYSNYREQMRLHMEKKHQEERMQAPASSNPRPEQTEKPNPNSAYGQGYHSRSRTENRPDMDSVNRPDRPRTERFNRGDMGRR